MYDESINIFMYIHMVVNTKPFDRINHQQITNKTFLSTKVKPGVVNIYISSTKPHLYMRVQDWNEYTVYNTEISRIMPEK